MHSHRNVSEAGDRPRDLVLTNYVRCGNRMGVLLVNRVIRAIGAFICQQSCLHFEQLRSRGSILNYSGSLSIRCLFSAVLAGDAEGRVRRTGVAVA